MAGDDVKEGCSVMGRVISLSDLILGFFENGETNPDRYGGDDAGESSDEDFDDFGAEQRKVFWESQHHILEALLSKSSSLETRIRQKTEAALRLLRSEARACSCSRTTANACRDCLLRGITERLRNAGFNSAVCRSKWRSSSSVSKGEHSYIDVVEKGEETRGPVRVVVEVCFRAEFEMARASEEYKTLVNRLPEVFVGKPERLKMVVKNVCAAAKKCMEDNKMHMPPWRKSKYMQAKWLSPCERELPTASRHSFPRATVLTYDLLHQLPGFHCPAVQVL